jgi:beta-glucosidase
MLRGFTLSVSHRIIPVPWGFRKFMRYLNERYAKPCNVPIVITENGFPVENEGDLPTLDAILEDTNRQVYFNSYLKEMIEAIRDDGVNLTGYFGWSLLE